MPVEATIPELPGKTLVFPDGMSPEEMTKATRLAIRDAAAQEGAQAQSQLDWLGPATDLVYGATPAGLNEASVALPKAAARAAGWTLGYLGKVARGGVESLMENDPTKTRLGAAVLGVDLPGSPANTPVKEGLAMAAEGAPTVAAGMLATAYGVPPAVAFGGPMAVQAYSTALDHGATDQQAAVQAAVAGTMGAVVPGVAKAGGEAAASALGQAVQRGLLSGKRTAVQKAVELLAEQGAVQVFMEGMNLPEYVAAPPEKRWDIATRNITANLPWLALSVPNVMSADPSRTQAKLGAQVGELMAKVLSDPVASEELARAVDEEAVKAAGAAEAPSSAEAVAKPPEEVNTSGTKETQGSAEVLSPAEGEGNPPVLGTPVAAGTPLQPSLARRVSAEATYDSVRQGLGAVVESVGGVPVMRSRRFGQRALGIFKTFERVVRMRDLNDVPTLAHEVAHHVSRQLFGGNIQRAVPPAVARELRQLGVALYGRRRPAGGYTEEGWAEFWRYYLTTDEARAEAPQVTDWFEKTWLPSRPETATRVAEARRRIDAMRTMSAADIARSQQRRHAGDVSRALTKLRRSFSFQGQFDAGAPLADLARTAENLLGRPLAPSESPWALFKFQRGRGGTVIGRMMEHEMVDIFGRPTGGASLAQELAPVTANLAPGESRSERIRQFWDYLYARRAKERWSRGLNPGIPEDVATRAFDELNRPEFQLAAAGYDRWWGGVLDYAASASPGMAGLVDAIRQGSKDYAPLARVLDEGPASSKSGLGRVGASNPFSRFGGSSRPVLELATQTGLSAERVINAAHREQILNTVYELATTVPGLGHLIERIPVSQRQNRVNVERIRSQLEGMGVDTSPIPDDTLITFYQAAEHPTGTEPIIVRRQPGESAQWYQVSPQFFDAVAGLRPLDLGPTGFLLFDLAARGLRLGTTGLRPSFGLITNPMVDLPTGLLQARSASNPVSWFFGYLRSIGALWRYSLPAAIGGKTSPALEAFQRSGVSGSTFIGSDVRHAQAAGKRLFRGKVLRELSTPIETYREAISFAESGPRLNEFERTLREMGWQPGQDPTPNQMVAASIAGSEVTTDFRARGDFGGDSLLAALQRGAPFEMAALQGLRTAGRALRHNLPTVMTNGLFLIMGPTLWNWWRNKDKDWYRALPAAERYGYWNIEAPNGEVLQIRKPREWGLMFAAIPEALLDRAYGQDPLLIQDIFKTAFTTLNPYQAPALVAAHNEQLRNRIAFWDRPIVPRAQLEMLPGAQLAPYSTPLAKFLGQMFPNEVSPRRVDHAVRALAGGAPMDALQLLGLAEKQERRGKELADIPIAGRLFRRGGTFSGQNRWMEQAYDIADGWNSRKVSAEIYPLTGPEPGAADYAIEQGSLLRTSQKLIEMVPDSRVRRNAYAKLAAQAKAFVQQMERMKMRPQDRPLPAPRPPQQLTVSGGAPAQPAPAPQ